MNDTKRFLQTEFWTAFKGNHGWTPYYFAYDDSYEFSKISSDEYRNNSPEKKYLAVLVRSFSLKIKKLSIAYVPMAPEDPTEAILEKISEGIKPFLPSNTMCVRFDPPIDFDTIEERDSYVKAISRSQGQIRPAPVAVQPPDTTVLMLDKTEDEILAAMKNKWRYNIRLAAKKNVQIEKYYGNSGSFEKAFENFFILFEQTSQRDGVSFHDKSYYLDLLQRGCPADDKEQPLITLYLAKHEDDYLAGIITLFFKGEAVYLYGASGNIKRNLMPAYLLQWTAIQDAKNYGCPSYDFYGMPPAADENHPMHGLYLFKTGFGGKIVHRPGSFDAILNKKDYRFYITAEKLRAWYHKKLLKKLKGR